MRGGTPGGTRGDLTNQAAKRSLHLTSLSTEYVQTGPYNRVYTESQLEAGGGFILPDFNEEQVNFLPQQQTPLQQLLLGSSGSLPPVLTLFLLKLMTLFYSATAFGFEVWTTCDNLSRCCFPLQCKAAYQSLLIADQHCRTKKYLLCLASGVPCVSHLWVRDCCKENKLLNYRNYLLPAGIGLDHGIVEW